ncbi:hypothetical protein ACHAPU_006877 [Fusarium lateritium]
MGNKLSRLAHRAAHAPSKPSTAPASSSQSAPSKSLREPAYEPPGWWISGDESDNYYGGVSGRPRLLARSDSESRRWSGQPNVCRYNRNSRLVALWVDRRGELVDDIMEATADLEVAKIDIFRVGPSGSEKKNKLVISVYPWTTGNTKAWDAAKNCRDVLRNYNFLHTEVEVREARKADMKNSCGAITVESDEEGDDY